MMATDTGRLMTGLALLAGLLLGAFAVIWWQRRRTHAQRRIPRRWPLSPRLVANSKEREVWRWLLHAFVSHHVMIKMPVTRFTMPRNKEQGLRWYQMLSGVYCTFTICNSDGHVIGCVDVPGRLGLPKKNEQLKRKLLRQCGIAYMVVEADDLPEIDDIRAEFLGDAAAAGRARQRGGLAVHRLRLAQRRPRRRAGKQLVPHAAGQPRGGSALSIRASAAAGTSRPPRSVRLLADVAAHVRRRVARGELFVHLRAGLVGAALDGMRAALGHVADLRAGLADRPRDRLRGLVDLALGLLQPGRPGRLNLVLVRGMRGQGDDAERRGGDQCRGQQARQWRMAGHE